MLLLVSTGFRIEIYLCTSYRRVKSERGNRVATVFQPNGTVSDGRSPFAFDIVKNDNGTIAKDAKTQENTVGKIVARQL